MRTPRISIRQLMALVVLVALAIAALKYANEWIASAIYTLVFGLLLVSLAGMIVRRGNKQLFWVGFGIFGFGYLLHAFEFSNNSVPDLLFVRVIDVAVVVFNLTMDRSWDDSDTLLELISGGSSDSSRPQSQVFHCLGALCCGFLGVAIVRLFAADQPKNQATERP